MTADEKRSAGIRANTKISKEYFATLQNPEIVKTLKPKDILHDVYQQAWHRHARAKELSKLRKDKFVAEVEIMNCGDERDCKASFVVNGKKYPIDSVPELPLKECDAPYCRCMYQPVIKF